MRLSLRYRVVLLAGIVWASPRLMLADDPPSSATIPVRAGQSAECRLGRVEAGRTYRFGASMPAPAETDARLRVELLVDGKTILNKALHAGDADTSIHVRPPASGTAEVRLRREKDDGPGPHEVRLDWAEVPLPADEQAAIEAEPNDSWRQANLLRLGRDVYGSGDDVDYLANPQEGRTGIDWFRFEVAGDRPVLATFHIDLLDRDISANLRVYTVDAKTQGPVPYLAGKDPMEMVHDRERERYSTFLTRTFTKGTYYLEVNANHPAYILRTRTFPLPPYEEPRQAVEAGLHYILDAGDAWFAQVPRAGNIYARVDNIHDTGTRCTGCHASSFPLEAGLAAHRSGYAIRDRDAFRYLTDRLASSITPLYGDDGLYWQRYIASPLQSQGQQGGLVADIEREVTGRETPSALRFAPFLKAAWLDRKELPDDEQNAVVPVDSKFGAAWRDWRVLKEAARRTGQEGCRKAADNLAAVVCSQRSDLRAENFQDRINRLVAWCLMDREGNAAKIRRESNRFLVMQNRDGGWHESSDGPGPSAVYATGQVIDALLMAGYSPDHPAIARALRYLLTQQQDFGGWFQTTTHENFRTPMRETLHAVTALARAFPAERGGPRTWGNRDGRPAGPPRTDSIVHTLDDLEALWEVPEAGRARLARDVASFLDHPNPLVRAAAAACLGRIGRGESAAALVGRLDDPSKIVWRAAAWSLRKLGNGGEGLDEIRRALRSPDTATRRGAVRIFAYQFAGLDEQVDLGDRLVELTRDTDLWTRLQAVKSLRQLFYRTSDNRFRRRIVDAFLDRMNGPADPATRKNLAEGLYIMLDENLGGGISLQRNLSVLPAEIRSRVLAARTDVERDVLLAPILAALERGPGPQRSAILAAFDGSFLGGRDYARQPEAAMDIGNDREFGFLYEVPTDVLDRTFGALLADASLDPIARRRSIRLCAFFKLPGRTANPAVQGRLLDALADKDSGVREAARDAVGRGLALVGAEDDLARIARLREMLARGGSDGSRPAILAAIGRNGRLASRPEIRSMLHALVGDPEACADLLPVIGQADFTEDERLAVVDRGWARMATARRIEALDILFARADAPDRSEPTAKAISILQRAAVDPSAEVREHAIEGIGRLPTFRAGETGTRFMLGTLADDDPAIRRLGLVLTSSSTTFWDRPDAQEHLARLLLDPDASVRSDALDLVRHHRQASRSPAIAARVKALMADPALAPRAEAILRAGGLAPENVAADVNLARLREPGLEEFRRRINPLFYRPSADGHSCASCHGNHAVLRIAPRAGGKDADPEELLINYRSALKAINIGRPESSLLLRKPLSPAGAGLPDASSATGLTHVGGPRWEGVDDEAYRSILDWIRNKEKP